MASRHRPPQVALLYFPAIEAPKLVYAGFPDLRIHMIRAPHRIRGDATRIGFNDGLEEAKDFIAASLCLLAKMWADPRQIGILSPPEGVLGWSPNKWRAAPIGRLPDDYPR